MLCRSFGDLAKIPWRDGSGMRLFWTFAMQSRMSPQIRSGGGVLEDSDGQAGVGNSDVVYREFMTRGQSDNHIESM